MYLTTPRRDGCTLIISLIQEAKSSTSPAIDFQVGDLPPAESSRHVLAALRVLLGSTSTDRIPRYLYIEGRQVEVSPGIKKWYSIQLTAEEIAISLRNGFIVLGIGPVRMSYCCNYWSPWIRFSHFLLASRTIRIRMRLLTLWKFMLPIEIP
jgi:hypothetical protein